MKFGVLVYLLPNDFGYINIYSGYKVLVIPTTKYIIIGTDYHFVIKLKSRCAFWKILKEHFLVMAITKECFKVW